MRITARVAESEGPEKECRSPRLWWRKVARVLRRFTEWEDEGHKKVKRREGLDETEEMTTMKEKAGEGASIKPAFLGTSFWCTIE